jgi:hypothetical protein
MAERERERGVTYTGVAATGAAILAALAWLKNPAAAKSEFPPELMQLLVAMAADLNSIDAARLPDILAAIKELTLGGGLGFPPNADYLTTVWVTCPIVNTAYPVPELQVPDGMSALIKSAPPPFNAIGSIVFVSTMQAPNVNMAYPLVPNETYPVRLKSTGNLWLFTNIAGSQAIVSVEQRR